MTIEQLETFADSLGNGWYFRSVTDGGLGIWRCIKNQGYPRYLDLDYIPPVQQDDIETNIAWEQRQICAEDKNGLTVAGRSGGWIGWSLSDLETEDETSGWSNDPYPTIKESVRQEIIVMADNIDAKIREMNTKEYWSQIFENIRFNS